MEVQNQLATSGWKAMKFKAKHGSRQAILVQFMPTIMGMSMTRVQTNQRILKINSEVASEFLRSGWSDPTFNFVHPLQLGLLGLRFRAEGNHDGQTSKLTTVK